MIVSVGGEVERKMTWLSVEKGVGKKKTFTKTVAKKTVTEEE